MGAVTIANVEMARAWDGEEGERWAEHAARYDAAGQRLWERFLDAGLVQAEHRVLDVGCGTGRSTRDVARLASSGWALGVDLSAAMLRCARERSEAEGVGNVAFEQGDAQVHPFEPGAFDVAVSSFGASFFDDPVAAFANIGRAVRPGGRLALLSWRELRRNQWLVALRDATALGRTLPEPPVGAPGPFGLADADHVRRVLAAAGWADVVLEPIDEPAVLGTDAEDAFAFVRTMGIVKGLTQDLDEQARARALDAVRAVLADHETDGGVLLGTSAWLVTARR